MLCWKRNGFFREPLTIRGTILQSGYLASHYAVLEAECPLWRAVTIIFITVRETSAVSSSQSLMVQSVCMIGNPSKLHNTVLVNCYIIALYCYRSDSGSSLESYSSKHSKHKKSKKSSKHKHRSRSRSKGRTIRRSRSPSYERKSRSDGTSYKVEGN